VTGVQTCALPICPGNGGGQQVNRIDSRARGNAPQLLEKYRKQAQDAHLNGDRVQAEYYLQFADHYFRVIADTRLRQEELRGRPMGERWHEEGADSDDGGDYSTGTDFPSFDQPSFVRSPRDDAPRPPRRFPEDRFEREDLPERAQTPERESGEAATVIAPPPPAAHNPFVRDERPRGGLRPRRSARRLAGHDEGAQPDQSDETPAGLDPASLPPAISPIRDDAASPAESPAESAKPRRGRPRRIPLVEGAGEKVE